MGFSLSSLSRPTLSARRLRVGYSSVTAPLQGCDNRLGENKPVADGRLGLDR
jgi:hypothetical protein